MVVDLAVQQAQVGLVAHTLERQAEVVARPVLEMVQQVATVEIQEAAQRPGLLAAPERAGTARTGLEQVAVAVADLRAQQLELVAMAAYMAAAVARGARMAAAAHLTTPHPARGLKVSLS